MISKKQFYKVAEQVLGYPVADDTKISLSELFRVNEELKKVNKNGKEKK